LQANSIGDTSLRTHCTLLLLLAIPLFGFGQQDPAARYTAVVASAQQAMSRSDFKTAAENYQQAVKMHPESAEMWANLGLMEHEGGDYSAAMKSFERAIHLKPSLYVPNLFLGIDSLHAGNISAAIQSLVKAELMNKTDPEAPLELGRAYSSAGNFPAAAKAFARAAELDPRQSDAWLGAGLAYLDQVEVDARKLSTDAPRSAYAQALYAESMTRQARYIEATDAFRKAIAAQPQPPCLHAEFGFMYVKQQKVQDAESEFKQETASCGIPEFLAQEQASGNIDENTYRLLIDARSGVPVTPPASLHNPLGELYSSIKTNQALALQSLTRFQEMAPNSAPSHILLGDMYRQRQRYDDAQAQYKLALEISPADHAALLGLAYAYYGNANLDAAIATAKLALATNPTDPELNLLMGEALVSRHAFAAAEPFLQKGLAAKPQMLPHVHALLGTVYSETGRTQDAIAQLEMGLGADQDGGTYYKLARMYRKTGDTKKADEAMQQVKVREQQRRQRAVTALEDSSSPDADDLPKP
jgi:tetratricopeptide (TPR) repeat protein